jgi:heme-degrading monooxygenase HmoA
MSRKTKKLDGYQELDAQLMKLAKNQKGFLGIESFTNQDGKDVSIVSFETEKDMLDWKMQPEHQKAQSQGRAAWYEHYHVRVCKVEREYEFNKK